MSSNKEMNKRQARRDQMRRKEQRVRLLSIGLISIVALFLAFLFIYPNFKPVGEASLASLISRPNVDFNAMGDPEAPIKIEEYSDFQCPFCRVFFEDTEEQLTENYIADGTVYFVYYSFGEFIGAESGSAAEAAYCAGDQGKFWEMHDIIFANQAGENAGAFADRRLLAFAEKIELNMDQFSPCFNGGKYKSLVEEDRKNGALAGITATPSFLMTYTVSGKEKTILIEGAQPFEVFKEQIEAALAEMGQ